MTAFCRVLRRLPAVLSVSCAGIPSNKCGLFAGKLSLLVRKKVSFKARKRSQNNGTGHCPHQHMMFFPGSPLGGRRKLRPHSHWKQRTMPGKIMEQVPFWRMLLGALLVVQCGCGCYNGIFTSLFASLLAWRPAWMGSEVWTNWIIALCNCCPRCNEREP